MGERTVVLVDARMARRRRTGAATYINSLRSSIEAIAPPDLDVRFVTGPPPLPRRNLLTRVGNLALDLTWIHIALPITARLRRAAVVHAPFNWGPLWSPAASVVTVQDLAWERMPQAFPKFFRIYARMFAKRSARSARTVITTSRSTARDLVDLYRVPGDRIRTIPIGVNADGASSTAPREPFVLMVGEFEPRKRVLDVIEGHHRYLRALSPDATAHRLVIAGAGGSQELAARGAAGPEVEFAGFVDDAKLADLYRRAALLVYASDYEGFGLPVVEAMAHGCPVLVAQNSSLVEVGGDAAIPLLDASPQAIAATLAKVLADPDELERRSQLGRRHAATFDWSRIAAETLEVYREAAR